MTPLRSISFLAAVGTAFGPALFPAPALATIYTVDQSHPSASDSGPGSEVAPWLTLGKAAASLVAGDTVYVKAGTYGEQLVPPTSGIVGAWITYSAYPGHTVTIDGATVPLMSYEALVQLEMVDYIRIHGFRVVNARSTATNAGVSADGTNHIVIDDNVTSNTSSSGIIIWGSTDVLVERNEVELALNAGAASENECISIGETDGFVVRYNHVHDGNPVRGEGIDAKDGSSNGAVYGNHVERVQSVGIYVDAWDKPTSNIDVYSNLIHDIDGDGISVGSEQGGLLSNVRFFNNAVYNNLWVGINVHACCVSSHPVSGLEIVNNTLYGNGTSGWGGGIVDENDQATGVVIRNNLCAGNQSFEIALEGSVVNVTADHNLIGASHGYPGEVCGSDCQVGDPIFASPGSGDLHLLAGSPAIDSGSVAGAPAYDFDGRSRPIGSAVDIGAFEFSPTEIFRDGFESGSTSAWSLAVT